MKTPSGSIVALLAIALSVAASQAQEVSNPVQPDNNEASDATLSQSSPASSGASSVRIVRLSQVNGAVQLDRNTDRGFEAAFANLPIVQNQRLQTHDGLAEVEFEDNTSLRITPDSLIEFPVLQRTASGSTITGVKLLRGTLYVSLANTKGNEFTVTVGDDKIVLTPSSHIRIDLGTPSSKLAVFNGNVQVVNESGTTTVGKKKALTFDATTQSPPVVASNGEPGAFDSWDKNSADYHNLRSVPAAYGGGSNLYGVNDLNYYGGFSNLAGCGSMWRPYLASAAWDPFANGIWAWYPGAGYSWVSPYPWGWTPFHSGTWAYCSGAGWGWRPGNQWIGLHNHPATFNTTKGVNCPKPPHAPAAGASTLVVVNTKPLVVSRLTGSDTFVFHKDSAGLGVPRESLGKLNKISAGVAQHGTVSTPVYVANSIPADAHSNMRASNPSAQAGQIRAANATHTAQTAASSGSMSSASHASSAQSGGSWSGGSHASSSVSSASSSSSAPAASSGGSHH
jgi:hypothetical protein